MNCQPGDLAIVIKECRWKGRLLEVLYARPIGRYILPDGYPAENLDPRPGWVVRLLEPIDAPLSNGRWRKAHFGDSADVYLKPLRGLPDEVDTTETATA